MSYFDLINVVLGFALGLMIGIWVGIVIGSGDNIFYDEK